MSAGIFSLFTCHYRALHLEVSLSLLTWSVAGCLLCQTVHTILVLSVFVFYMTSTGMSEKERQMMNKLKDMVDKQRDEIRAKDHELTQRNEDIEAVRNCV